MTVSMFLNVRSCSMTRFVCHMKPFSRRVLNPGHVTHERFETESDVVLRFEVFAVRADFGSSSFLDLRLRSCSSRMRLSLHPSFHFIANCLILCSLMMHFELQQSLLPHACCVLPYTQLDSVKKLLKAVTKRPVCCRVVVVMVTVVTIVSGCPAASLRLNLQSQFNSMLLCSQ